MNDAGACQAGRTPYEAVFFSLKQAGCARPGQFDKRWDSD